MSAQLLPCPLCQSDRVTVWIIRDGMEAVCKDCKCKGPPAFHGPNNDTHARAIAAWNTRAPNAAAEGLAKALEEVLPYTEAERLAETAAVRCGAMRDPIYKAIRAAQVVLAAYRAGQPS